MLAVNKDGVVAATRYGRSGLPEHVMGAGGVPPPVPGSDARVRISCDGGKMWQPSAKLNEAPIQANQLQARYWTDLAAAADGRFHTAWIGNATGKRQVWTAAIHITVTE